ncbi:MAG TPA: flagellar hook-basal body complex protein [Verrucomicrobiae bacterium]|nr:flagellar hook-basal body complex protein [Verrucomicrobiae bacterium]
MLSSLTSGVSGLDSFQTQMDVIGNNIANLNTTGYKASTVDFEDAFSNQLMAPSGGTSTSSGSNAIQVGTGVGISGITNNWAAGATSSTGIASNLAITGNGGNGFFTVKDQTTGNTYATRDGTFTTDLNGNLVTENGENVQGYTDGTLSTVGNIKIDITGSPSTSPMVSYSIDSTGKVTVVQQDGTTFVRGQVLLQNYADPQKLVNVGNNLYTNIAEAGPSALGAPGTAGLGNVQGSAIELSNVDLSGEMANLISAQRAFEANSKIITTSNEVLQTVVNLKQS